MTPPTFQSPRTLRRINIAAVALSLASITGAIFGSLGTHTPNGLGLLAAIPTLLTGAIWAWLMRGQKTIGATSLRRGWIASIPLAALNAGLAMGLMVASERPPSLSRFFVGVFMGATFGAIVWIPALVATLVCFGVPIASAQRLAKRGLAGEERGERIVGWVCAAISVGAILMTRDWHAAGHEGMASVVAIRSLGILGLATGGGAALLASAREARRRGFVAAVEAGRVPNYRVDATTEGKVLMRVVSHGEGYRVGDFDEALVELDPKGDVKRAG